ncbi:MAG: SIMPL domain-containing protein [Chloroflexi bacterium]|nr:SIMPL domain-containing protein [Chloroflexota bacterium]
MRKRMVVSMGLLIALAIVVSGCASAAQAGGPLASVASQTNGEQVTRTITVTGSGTAAAAPDVAYVVLGVETIDESAAKAVRDNSEKMNAMMAALKAMGIADKDVQTSRYNMWLEQEDKPEARVLTDSQEQEAALRYHVVNQVRVTVRDVAKVGELMDKALQAGANRVEGVSFGIEDTDTLSEQAREDAIADAKAKADQLAAGFGTKVGAVYSVTEFDQGRPVALAQEIMPIMADSRMSISAGEISVNVQVQVQFEIAK